MSKFLAALGLSTALAAATALPLATQAEAAMSYGGQSIADLQHQIAPVEKAQFFVWGGIQLVLVSVRLARPRLVLVRLRMGQRLRLGRPLRLERLVHRALLPLWQRVVVVAASPSP